MREGEGKERERRGGGREGEKGRGKRGEREGEMDGMMYTKKVHRRNMRQINEYRRKRRGGGERNG